MKYKVICTDLDGTLLDSDSNLSEENSKAIEEIVKQGIIFVPTTGRTIAELPKAVREHKSIRYFIYSNGAGIYDSLLDKSYETLIDNSRIAELVQVMSDYKILLLCHKDRWIFMDGDEFPKCNEYKVWKSYLELFKILPPELLLANFKSFLLESENIEMLVGFFGKEESRVGECMQRLSEIDGIHITSSADGNVEIVNEAANKGNAVKRFSELIGIDTDSFITVGDSLNDIEMLKLAGLSFAVSGAKEETKAAASEVICSNDEHIAKYILENVLNA